MQTIKLSEIVLPASRQRTKTDPQKFQDLKSSILSEGLFHAIILSKGNLLVAGATRLGAIRELYEQGSTFFYNREQVPAGEVPITYTHKTDEASIFKIELEENLRREALSPVDEAQALAALHRLQCNNAPVVFPGTGLKAQVTFQDTAKVLGEITGKPQTTDSHKISDSIIVDKFKDLPEVRSAKTFSEAVRLAKKAAERAFREVLGKLEAGPQEGRHHLVLGDCKEVLPTIQDGIVDVIIADPPYGVGADQFGEQSLVGHEYKDDERAFRAVITAINQHASRICKPDAALFMFLDINVWQRLEEDMMIAAYDSRGDGETDESKLLLHGWYIWPTPLIWHKPNRGHAPQPKRGPSRRYETILYAIRGNREVRKVGSDVLTFNVPDDRQHGAGKPVELYQELLSWVAYPGDVVLDPCGGSGTVIEAADKLDLSAICVERDPGFFTLCQERLKKEMK
jgi:site-specific DNA-methyltransferase (adenine-specific)